MHAQEGWVPSTKYWQRNAWDNIQNVDFLSYTITDGHMHIGATNFGDFEARHHPNAKTRVVWQSFRKNSKSVLGVENWSSVIYGTLCATPFIEVLSIAGFVDQVIAVASAR